MYFDVDCWPLLVMLLLLLRLLLLLSMLLLLEELLAVNISNAIQIDQRTLEMATYITICNVCCCCCNCCCCFSFSHWMLLLLLSGIVVLNCSCCLCSVQCFNSIPVKFKTATYNTTLFFWTVYTRYVVPRIVCEFGLLLELVSGLAHIIVVVVTPQHWCYCRQRCISMHMQHVACSMQHAVCSLYF